MDKLMFWKKGDDFDFDKDLGDDLGPGASPPTPNLGSGPDNKELNIPSLEGSESGPPGSSPKDDLALPGLEYSDPAMAKLDNPKIGPLEPMSNNPMTQATAPGPSNPGPPVSPVTTAPLQSAVSEVSEKNMEVISAKLDMLKVSIESLNQKLDNLTRIASDHSDTDQFKKHW
ncbi:MAG: hypothetical protein QF632_01925 [Candidatus Woesearchaeota archaeon]|nr:hypothetical protein [Candidatus Woesearchaeota archaeon]MDP7323499.1 hypothetical protein [Candidatus Woesearchaeota archaeon]MDP7458187.1 hypothetical protein [Candidatus Woesearchaeota archaeon]